MNLNDFKNDNGFIPSFVICMTFTSFSCLLTLARLSSITLNRNGESKHLSLVHNLGEKVFDISPLSMILLLSFS